MAVSINIERILKLSGVPEPGPQPPAQVISHAVPIVLGTAPFVVGRATLAAETGGGLYWVLAGMIAAIVGAVINAWVLLVEILR